MDWLSDENRTLKILADAADITKNPIDRVSMYSYAARIAHRAFSRELEQIAVWGLVGIGQDEKVERHIRKRAYYSADHFSDPDSNAKIMAREGLEQLDCPKPPARIKHGNKSSTDVAPGG